ncbi:SafA/ExsA family spore coat assembly protein [Alkalibacillus haloalkaliphilus]|uniref:SafA/ExsA family spore coat assembly protein n=1 Tax=Alkalibacillus haloalkaliphilus TaxID=94136 RepID=UPI002936510B|nr:SafA/ExsA family spore coat assembly protein [Alkalibacillus haloalkaliphilus]MDV2582470.1 SafA/ExsA family spore coat assembly protein [Alkalibacillus haloalkaliphilus]
MRIFFYILMALVIMTIVQIHPSEQSHADSVDIYTVQPGDTLWKISRTYQIGLSEIINANPQFDNPDLIYPGDDVTIPLKTEVKSIEDEVIRITNEMRQQHGLQPLEGDWQLSRVARYKSRDMRDQNYFSHQSPTYGSPFDMIEQFNVSYQRASENIAAGQQNPRSVVDSWMNSQGHRENILDPNMTHIGVGYAEGGQYRHYWTQMFIAR